MKLTDKMKNAILDEIKSIDVNVNTLESYRYHPAASSEHAFASDSWEEWDEKEEFDTQREWFYNWVKEDGISEYIDCPDDEELTQQALDYIEKEV